MIELTDEQKKQLTQMAKDMETISVDTEVAAEKLAKSMKDLVGSMQTFWLAMDAAIRIFNDRIME